MRWKPNSSTKGNHVRFPLVIGVSAAAPNLKPQVAATLQSTLRKIHERSSFGALVLGGGGAAVVQVAQAAESAGLPCRFVKDMRQSQTAAEEKGTSTTADMELVEMCDILLVVAKTKSSDPSARSLSAYCHRLGRSVIEIDLETGASEGDIPEQVAIDQGWLPQLFQTAGLSPDADLEAIKSRMSLVANTTAPITRVRSNWIVFLQGLAICVPLGWLVQRALGLSLELVAVASACAALLLMAAVWRVRWRGMHKDWARSRLVAEAARSLLATASSPEIPAWRTLAIVPSLRPLRWVRRSERKTVSFAEWRDLYIASRIDKQEQYFSEKQKGAEGRRAQFSRWTTILLDVLMVLAFTGLVIALAPTLPDGRLWINLLGGELLEILIGIAGVATALSLLLIQALRDIHDLNRRSARFAQQRQMLGQARLRLGSARSAEEAFAVVEDTESKLLAEVLEWYFQAETAEHFVGIREAESGVRGVKPLALEKQARVGKLGRRIAARTGVAGLFVLRVLLGRVAWILGTAAVVLVWIAFNLPHPGPDSSWLESDLIKLRFMDMQTRFDPLANEPKYGCIVLVHGLYGSAIWDKNHETDERNWMAPCAAAIEGRMKQEHVGKPDICLVDWRDAAKPSVHYTLPRFAEKNLLADLAAIRPQAYQVGDSVAIQLAKLINEGKIDKKQPLHLIGHSAGGFIVARVAIRLSQLGLVPDSLLVHITILDTPAPGPEIITDLPRLYPRDAIDFYITSAAGGAGVNPQKLHVVRLSREGQTKPWWDWGGLRDDHRWAYQWFKQTVSNPKMPDGFNRSPLLHPAPAIWEQ